MFVIEFSVYVNNNDITRCNVCSLGILARPSQVFNLFCRSFKVSKLGRPVKDLALSIEFVSRFKSVSEERFISVSSLILLVFRFKTWRNCSVMDDLKISSSLISFLLASSLSK